MIAKIILFFHFEIPNMSQEEQKTSEIFQASFVPHVGSGGALTAWKILDFELSRHFNVAILANCSKTSVTIIYNTYRPRKTSLLNLIYFEGKTDCSEVDAQLNPISIG